MSRLRVFAEALVQRLPTRLQPMVRWRFIKFGAVGASGTVVNLLVLYLAQEFLLRAIRDLGTRLNYSIALAISLATLSNFYWNRRLTWRDRQHLTHPSAAVLLARYVMAAGLAIALQSVLTKVLAAHMHYLLANLLAIGLASGLNFFANDKLTFRRRRSAKQRHAHFIQSSANSHDQ